LGATTTTRPGPRAGAAGITELYEHGRRVAVVPSADLETALEVAAHWVARAVRDGSASVRWTAVAGDGVETFEVTLDRRAPPTSD
jgi:hypothetical protein